MRCLNRFEKGLFFAVMAVAFVGSPIFGATVYGAGNLDESVFAKAVPAPASDFDYQLLDSLEGGGAAAIHRQGAGNHPSCGD